MVPILESGERLVICGGSARIRSVSAYQAQGRRSALRDVWLRRDAADRLADAARLLPPGLSLLLLDGWRPLELQAELYEEFRGEIQRERGLTGRELERETLKFVSAPDPDPAAPPPHMTGGAVDLTLASDSGAELDMGGTYDELTERSETAYYEPGGAGAESAGATEYRDRRRLLCAVMTHCGFSNYSKEWWHFDTGNQWHHRRVGGPARYGLITSLS